MKGILRTERREEDNGSAFENLDVLMNEVLKQVRPVNMQYMLELFSKAKQNMFKLNTADSLEQEGLQGKDVVILMGQTGAGKSTTIQVSEEDESIMYLL